MKTDRERAILCTAFADLTTAQAEMVQEAILKAFAEIRKEARNEFRPEEPTRKVNVSVCPITGDVVDNDTSWHCPACESAYSLPPERVTETVRKAIAVNEEVDRLVAEHGFPKRRKKR